MQNNNSKRPMIYPMRILLSALSLTFLFTLSACIEELTDNSFPFQELLVVDGILTDELNGSKITLNHTSPVNTLEESKYIGEAEVWVIDQLGERVDFIETQRGTYLPPNSFLGIPGYSYQLFFITEQGKQYQSTQETLVKSSAIDSIYMRYAELPTEEENNENVHGLQFFIDSHGSS